MFAYAHQKKTHTKLSLSIMERMNYCWEWLLWSTFESKFDLWVLKLTKLGIHCYFFFVSTWNYFMTLLFLYFSLDLSLISSLLTKLSGNSFCSKDIWAKIKRVRLQIDPVHQWNTEFWKCMLSENFFLFLEKKRTWKSVSIYY